MRSPATAGIFCLLLVSLPAAAQERLVLRNATIWSQSDAGLLEDADIWIADGKIAGLGVDLNVPAGTVELDARGRHVTPGLIDCHSHTAIRGGVNEGSNNVTAEVRIADVIDPLDIDLYRQLAGGVTTIHALHGSANSIGGQDAVIKLRWGATYDELPIADANPGIKFALGENPKRSNSPTRPGATARYPATRMGVMESIRERFISARDYAEAWRRYKSLSRKQQSREVPPRRDLQLEAIAEILSGARRIHSHSYRQDEILALLRLAEEFEITIGTFQHVLEGYKVADELAAHGAGASTFSDWWAYKLEAYDAIPFNGALMHERGVRVSFNSDSSELARRLNLEAAKAVKYGGVAPTDALDFVTRNAAVQLGIDHRTGSLAPDMDADLVLWSGDPLSVYSIALRTWVDGITRFDREQDLQERERIADERRNLLERLNAGAVNKQRDEPATDDKPELPVLPALEYRDRQAASGEMVSVVHAQIHPGDGSVIEDGTVTFRRGRIVAIEPGGLPPTGARILDASGLQLHPGFIDANTALGLTEIGSVSGGNDLSELGDLHPNVNTSIAINPDSELLPVTRTNGTTHALSVPAGGLLSGSSTLIRLDGWSWEDLLAASPVAMHVRWPSFADGRGRLGGRAVVPPEDAERERTRRLNALDRLLDDARGYALARDARDAPPVERNPLLESVLPLLDGRQRVIVHADQIPQIESAIAWSEKRGLRIVLAGAGDLWRVASRLAEKEIPVIVTSVLGLPRREDEAYDTAYALPARLQEAGVTFCIASSGTSFDAPMARNLPYHAAMAVAHGLDRSEALRALTLYPARILGLERELGSIEVGKSASLILTDGDPLEIRSRVRHAFIDGRPVELDANKHERLYRKYRSRPSLSE